MQTRTLPQYSAAESLEQRLGDPFAPGNAFSFGNAVALDEREEYPEQACEILDALKVSDHYIPSQLGGELKSFEEFIAVLRMIARRDLTVAIAHGKTYLGAVAVWVGGSGEQRRRLVEIIRSGSQVALALTERSHGSDLLASDTEATSTAGGYTLSGEKWLINNATRGRALTVFAKTGNGSDPRGFSLFLVEKNNDARSTWKTLPKIKTHGIRGADISGISFDRMVLPEDAVVGRIGAGLEIMLKAFQLTRTVITGLSLGAADTALRITMDFALTRRLYGDSVFAIPHARRLLCDAFIDVLICECLSIASARSIHVEPEQMSVRSAIAKFFVPTTVEKILKSLSVVMGARQYLRQEHCDGVFQKIYRDNGILSLFDGSTAVNLHAIGAQLGQLTRRVEPENTELSGRLARIFSLTQTLPEFDTAALELHNRGRDSVLQGLKLSFEKLSSIESKDATLELIIDRTQSIMIEVERQRECVAASLSENGFNKSPEMFEQAEKYCALEAAACCVHMWVHNREELGEFFRRGDWLVLSLERLLMKLGRRRAILPTEHEQRVAAELERLYQERQLFSIVPFQLAILSIL
ncbi:MAG TPA: acyl-CoA dehydrogenase [Pyrinomonadaceae bacterium]|nr:acyl-CoA dehydrogenase [Pyrinomonadaceae bacterium]